MVAAVRLRRCALALAALVLGGCVTEPPGGTGAAPAEPLPARLLAPWVSLDGARIARSADPTGTPSLRAGPLGLRRFVHVASAAVQGNDLYVVDSGAASVFRLDLGLRLMTPLPGVPAHATTRVLVGADLSLYVLDAQRRRVLRISRNGQVIATYAEPLALARPVDLALDEPGGELLVADGVLNQLIVFHPLGGASRVVTLRGDEGRRVRSIAAIAAGADALYLSDPACGCIARVGRDGSVLDTFGHGEVVQPGPIALDRHGRVFVADRFDRSLKVFAAGRLMHALPAGSLGLGEIGELRIAGDWLVLADGPNARVELLRIAPPATAAGAAP